MANYIIRYGAMRLLGVFSSPADHAYRREAGVVVRSERGLEAGDVLCEATPGATAEMPSEPAGQILRPMSADDLIEQERIHKQEKEEFTICHRCIAELRLEMQLVDVEHIFGGERIIVYYLAEGRVDFRELVRKLASEFQTRIEMRQIGVRDEAKLLADYADCGKPVCCNTHLVQMPPVSMKMAKLQKATLDPTKISGRCGRLKCCLRYEFETYEKLQKELPPLGSRVMTPEGRARVTGHEILAGQVVIETDDHRRKMIDAAEVSMLADENRPAPRRDAPKTETGDASSSQELPANAASPEADSGRPVEPADGPSPPSPPADASPNRSSSDDSVSEPMP
jgi:cell fate regulator YaaT (PSP1 superfamily)